MKINVAIVEDHPMTLNGLVHMFREYAHIHLTGAYSDGKALMRSLEKLQPDILLLDIHLPDKTGDKLASSIAKKYPSVRIIALTNLDSSFYIYNMLKEGAWGYLLKSADGDTIVKAIESVYNGKKYIENDLKKKMDFFAEKMKNKDHLNPNLSPKEKEVLQLTIQGCTIQDISKTLFLSQRTVEYYRSNLLLKLDVKNMAELIKKAIEYGLYE